MKTRAQIKVSSNKRNRTFTIRVNGSKYRTLPMSKQEFNDADYRTQNDWINFLKTSQAYYVVR